MKKILKITLIALGVIVLIVLGAGLFGSKKYDIRRTVWIKADRKTVWDQATLFANFNKWNPWLKYDTAMKQTLTGTDGEKGATWSWESEEAGSGTMINTEVTPMDKRTYSLQIKNWGNTSTCEMTFRDSADGVWVSWGMKGENGFMGTAFMTLMGGAEKALGKDYEAGLVNLKKLCESLPVAAKPWSASEITLKDFPKTVFVQLKRTASIKEYEKNAGTWTGEMAGQLMQYITNAKLQMRGTLFSIYYNWDMAADKTEFAIAVPVDKESSVKADGISYSTLGGVQCATLDFTGDYKYTGQAHMAMGEWLKKANKTEAGPTMEEYVTDPATEKDPSKWLTRIWYPVK